MVGLLTRNEFVRISTAYRAQFGLPLFGVDGSGEIRFQAGVWPGLDDFDGAEARRFVVEESWRWGEFCVCLLDQRLMLWGIPLTVNNELCGGLVSISDSTRLLLADGDGGGSGMDIHQAGLALRTLAEAHNLTNAAALAARRAVYEAEQQRAYVLHRDVGTRAGAIRGLYTREEPELFSAIRSGDRGSARNVLNRILVAVFHYGGADLAILKGLLLELVGSMSRAAIEAGANPEELFGASAVALSALADVASLEAISAWLRGALERLMDAVPVRGTTQGRERILKVLRFLEKNCSRPLTLAEAAHAAGLSSSRFCAVLRQETGSTFSRILQRMRVDRAASMVRTGDTAIGEIATRCGFADQSYFTRVFRRERGCTPRQFRRRMAKTLP